MCVLPDASNSQRRRVKSRRPRPSSAGGQRAGASLQLVPGHHDTPRPGYDPDVQHSFMLWRLLPHGRWVGCWSYETQTTVACRAQCTCGWEGPAIEVEWTAGREAEADRERLYDYWDRHHVPDWTARHLLA